MAIASKSNGAQLQKPAVSSLARSSPPPTSPLIPESLVSIPDQRFYTLAFLGGLQAYKASDAIFYFVRSTFSSSTARPVSSTFLNPLASLQWLPFVPSAEASLPAYLAKWCVLDLAMLVLVMGLKVPGIRFGWGRLIVYASMLWMLDAFVFGKFEIISFLGHILSVTLSIITGTRGKVINLSERSTRRWDVLHQEDHLLGSLTVKILPYGTAVLNPLSATYCIPPDSNSPVFIPLVLNNSEPHEVKYKISKLWSSELPEEVVISGSSLRKYSKYSMQKSSGRRSDPYWDEEDEADEDDSNDGQSWFLPFEQPAQNLLMNSEAPSQAMVRRPSVRPDDALSALPKLSEPSQKIYYLPIQKTGLVELIKVIDEDQLDFRIKRSAGALIVECPSSGHAPHSKEERLFLDGEDDGKETQYRCIGDKDDMHALVRGVGSLSVGWKISERGNPRSTQHHLLSGIEREQLAATDGTVAPRDDRLQLSGSTNLGSLPSRAYTHEAGFSLSHERPGVFDVEVLNVSDSLLNVYHPQTLKRSFEVLQRPSVSFAPLCANVEPQPLLKGKQVNLALKVHVQDERSPTVKIKLAFKPDSDSDAKPWTRDIETNLGDYNLIANAAGTYTIESIDGHGGKICAGSVFEPSSCVVKSIPEPCAQVDMESVQGCAGDVAVNAKIRFQGTPPFAVSYTQQRKGDRPTSKRLDGIHSPEWEMQLEPPQPGEWTWKFDSVGDRNYNSIPLDIKPFHQVMHPLASLAVRSQSNGRSRPQDIWTCKTNETSVALVVSGTPPFVVDYTVGWATGSFNEQIKFDKAGSQNMVIPVPEALRASKTGSNSFSVAFTNIRDGNGCPRLLQTKGNGGAVDANFIVKTTTPTVRFDIGPEDRLISLVEGQSRSIPVRLTGERSWSVRYSHTGESGKTVETEMVLSQPNESFKVDKRGTYRLISVRDAHCNGQVIGDSAEIEVQYVDRPEVSLAPGFVTHVRKQQYIRQAICAGEEDHFALDLKGRSPFDVRYTHTYLDTAGARTSSVDILRSAQSQGILHLSSTPGQHTYGIQAVGDGSYPLSSISKTNDLFTIQQLVHRRPTAYFRKHPVLSFCLGDRFKVPDSKVQVEFHGQAPFTATFNIREPGSRSTMPITVQDIKTSVWDFSLPDYTLRAVGSYIVELASMTDSSGCSYEASDEVSLYVTAEVVEPASIVAVDKQEHYCVGDLLDFVLQGSAPWTVTYKWNGKTFHSSSDTATFSRLAEKKGDFEIQSVAHKKNQCQTPVKDIKRTIHPLPAAKVKEGNSWTQSLHEGDQAEIIFSFVGTPPFTFTYTRSILSSKKVSTVVETQTITGVMDNAYTIYSSLEGQYRVTYIADAYCSYPPTDNRLTGGSQRLLMDG